MQDKAIPQRILALDDSIETLQILQHTLQAAGFEVVTVTSAEAGLQYIRQAGLPHLAVVDYHMPPGMDGFAFSDQILRYSDLPLIMLTALEDEAKIVEAIENYAEDYVLKPFSPSELVARIRRVLSRVGVFPFPAGAPIQADSQLQVHFPLRQAILRGGKSASLTPTETKLLYILLRQPGEVVTTDYLLRRMWPREIAYDDRLHVHVHRLRSKLRKLLRHTLAHEYIISERGVGYLFQPYAEPQAEPQAEP